MSRQRPPKPTVRKLFSWAVWLAVGLWIAILVLPIRWSARLLGVEHWLLKFWSLTGGWIRLKLGFWQMFAVSGYRGFGDAPSWVSSAARKSASPRQDTTLVSGEHFQYFVDSQWHGRKRVEHRFYRRLRAPLAVRVGRTLKPRWPRTRTEWIVKAFLTLAVGYAAAFSLSLSYF
jgi:hypothetical protein